MSRIRDTKFRSLSKTGQTGVGCRVYAELNSREAVSKSEVYARRSAYYPAHNDGSESFRPSPFGKQITSLSSLCALKGDSSLKNREQE